MKFYELEDLYDKISFHCNNIENELEMLSTLVPALNISSNKVNDIRMILRDIYMEFEEKYENEKYKIMKNDEEDEEEEE